MKNKFENIEDLEILIVSLVGTIWLTTIDSPSIGIKIAFWFLIFVDTITTINVGKSLVGFIKGFKKNKNESKLEENNEKKLEISLEKEKNNEKSINYEIKKSKDVSMDYDMSNINKQEKSKQLILKK